MAVLVRAPARLHLGFIPAVYDSTPGSVAVSINSPFLEISLEKSRELHVSGPLSDEIFRMAMDFIENYAPERGVEIEVRNAIPRHAGFGSGTRMALSVGMGISALYDLEIEIHEIADFFGRGRNSRAGIESLVKGGLVIIHPDGRASSIITPSDWRFVVALPESRHDFYGEEEKKAMKRMDKGIGNSEDLAVMLEKAIESRDISKTGKILERIDRETGKMFSASQKGDFSHEIVSELIQAGMAAGAYGAGQSSWGPAVYFLVDERVEDSVTRAIEYIIGDEGVVESTEISPEGITLECTED